MLPSVGLPFDSGSQRHEKPSATRHNAEAMKPGRRIAEPEAMDPITGPIITPALVAADSQPSASARFSGVAVSLT